MIGLQWRRICEWPGFWTKLRLSVKPTNLQAFPQVLEQDQKIPQITFKWKLENHEKKQLKTAFIKVLALPRLAALKRLRIRQVIQMMLL